MFCVILPLVVNLTANPLGFAWKYAPGPTFGFCRPSTKRELSLLMLSCELCADDCLTVEIDDWSVWTMNGGPAPSMPSPGEA